MDKVGGMSDEKELFSLTELAEDAGISWRNYLSKAIRKDRDIFARLKGVERLNVHSSIYTLNSLEEMNEFRTPATTTVMNINDFGIFIFSMITPFIGRLFYILPKSRNCTFRLYFPCFLTGIILNKI